MCLTLSLQALHDSCLGSAGLPCHIFETCVRTMVQSAYLVCTGLLVLGQPLLVAEVDVDLALLLLQVDGLLQ